MGSVDVARIARERFGYDRLRPGQKEAVECVLAGSDTLVVMPTGAGKSAIYQLAAVALPGPTVVVSPLLALQRDQVEAIEERSEVAAAQLNSTLTVAEREQTLERLEDQQLEFVFLAPEQLANDEVLERVRAAKPSLFVVDEAHCVSEWGHDFRPDYLRLGAAIEAVGRPTALALTATASPPVRAEIVERLGMRNARVVVRGFDRPNIWLGVETHFDEGAKLEGLVERVQKAEPPGIVYTATRRRAEELANELASRGLRARPYHAGLRDRERETTQAAFMDDDLDVIVATVAFGMGIDKANVRFVFHSEISDSVDTYYQELGRAGRDGGSAVALLFYRPQDLGLRRFQASAGQLDLEEVERVAEAVGAAGGAVDPAELEAETDLSESKLAAVLNRLDDAGALEVLPSGDVEAAADDVDWERAADEAVDAQERRREFERSRVEMIRSYAELRGCRRGFLLNYFGEPFDEPCGNCDNCDAGAAVEARAHEPFALGSRVLHGEWGEGVVQRYDGDTMIVLFDEAGYKTLAVGLVVDGALLTLTDPR